MIECERFPADSSMRTICEGKANLPLYKINAYREKWGFSALAKDQASGYTPTVVAAPHDRSPRPRRARHPSGGPRRSTGKREGGCKTCGGGKSRATPKPNGWGPGSQLLKNFESAGVPHCPACIELAGKMDRWGKRGCQKRLDAIVADILPRAREWMSENQSFLHALFSAVKMEDTALTLAIRRKVQKAIQRATPKPLPKRRKPRSAGNSKAPRHRPDDKSNLISSTAIGQPTYAPGAHKTVERIPFTVEPTRNLIYHVWPSTCDDVWRWNLDLLLEHIDLFSGRRIVAIAVDHEIDAEAVQDHLAGEVLEFMIFRNNPQTAEMVSFLPLLAQVESHNPNEVTFRAHAKGTHRICKENKPHLREWIEMLYRTNLGDWPMVREHLESAAMTGSCRKFNLFRKRQRDPVYSGSFYWFRNCFVFSREWFQVDDPRWGCESWPGKQFSESETRCLFQDETGSMYSINYWRNTVKPAYDEWLKKRGLVV